MALYYNKTKRGTTLISTPTWTSVIIQHMRREVPVNQSRGLYLALVGSWINPLALQTREPLSCSSVFTSIFWARHKSTVKTKLRNEALHCKGQSPLLLSLIIIYTLPLFSGENQITERRKATLHFLSSGLISQISLKLLVLQRSFAKWLNEMHTIAKCDEYL